MNVLKTLTVVGIALAGLVAWDMYKPAGGLRELASGIGHDASDAGGGFAEIPMPDGMSARGVVIFTPQDCPSDAAQRAEALASRLAASGIPFRRADSAEYSQLSSPEQAQRVVAVMQGPIPVVYVNGRAKANPTAAEVIAEYRRGKG